VSGKNLAQLRRSGCIILQNAALWRTFRSFFEHRTVEGSIDEPVQRLSQSHSIAPKCEDSLQNSVGWLSHRPRLTVAGALLDNMDDGLIR
jgi:hypothetical protein